MTAPADPPAVPRWEPSEMMRKLAAWEDPYGDGPWDSKHIELQRGEAARMVAEFDRLRAIEVAAGAVPDTGQPAGDGSINELRTLVEYGERHDGESVILPLSAARALLDAVRGGPHTVCPACGSTVRQQVNGAPWPHGCRAVPDTGHQPAADLPARLRFAYSEAAHLGWHGVAATLLDLAGQLEPGDDDDSDEVCAAIARALASASPSGDTEKPCVRCSSRGAPVCCCVDGPVPATGHPTAPPADLPFVPDEMWLTAEWGVIESDGSGAWRTIENGLYVETLPAVRIRLVPEVDAAASSSGDTRQDRSHTATPTHTQTHSATQPGQAPQHR